MKKRRKPLTLIEIMVVIFLIGLIGSVIGFKMKDSLEDGKAFKTRTKIEKIKDVLELEIAKGKTRDKVIERAGEILAKSSFFKEEKQKILLDGWGDVMIITAGKGNRSIVVKSDELNAYDARHKESDDKNEESNSK